MRGALMFVGLQVGWFSCVLGGARGLPWLGPAVVLVLLAIHLRFATVATERRRELALIVGFGLIGTVADSLQSGLGLLTFAGSEAADSWWLAPPWIAALWFHFATVLTGPLQTLRRRRVVLLVFTVIGAPLSYVAGARLAAVTFHPAVWPSLLSIALVWSVVLPVALAVAPPRHGGFDQFKEPVLS